MLPNDFLHFLFASMMNDIHTVPLPQYRIMSLNDIPLVDVQKRIISITVTIYSSIGKSYTEKVVV